MKHTLFFYKEAGSNFSVVHTELPNGEILCHAASDGEHGLDLALREDHGTSQIQTELNEMIKTLDINSWDRFNKEDEFELTHFETCMGPVTKDYDFVIEWED